MLTSVVGVQNLGTLWEIQAIKVGSNITCSDFVSREQSTNVEDAGVDINEPLLDGERNVTLGSEEIDPLELGSTVTEKEDDILAREKQVHVNFLEGFNVAFRSGLCISLTRIAAMTAVAGRKFGRGRECEDVRIFASKQLKLCLAAIKSDVPQGHKLLVRGKSGHGLRSNVDLLRAR